MCKKNKIDVVKVVCSSAVKKLAVLSLAVAVSSGAVANAQMSGKDAKKQLSEMSSLERLIETNGDEEKRQRLNALNSDIEEAEKRLNTLEQQFEKKNRQLEEKKRQLEEKRGTLEWFGIAEVVKFLQDETVKLRVEIKNLVVENRSLVDEIGELQDEITNLLKEQNTLLRQSVALRDELEGAISEAQRDQAELMDLAVAEARRQNRPVHEVAPRFFANVGLPQEAIQNIMRLFGHGQQQNQRQQYFGGSFNPFNWGLFGGGKK